MGESVDQAHFQVARPAAQPLEHRVDLGGLCQQAVLLLQDSAGGQSARSATSSTCICPIISRWRRSAAMKPPPGARQLGHEGGAGHHRRLFDRHRHQHIPAVDEEIESDAQRQGIRADHVFDHVIGLLRQSARRPR